MSARSPLVCDWCGRRRKALIGCEEHWGPPLRQVCDDCFERLDALDLEACRGGILRWSGPYSHLGRRSP